MKLNFIITLFIILCLPKTNTAQILFTDSIVTEPEYYIIDSTKTRIEGYYGYYFSGTIERVDSSYFQRLLGKEYVSPVSSSYQYGGNIGFMRGKLFIGSNFNFHDTKREMDTLSSKLNQFTTSLNLGYNIVQRKSFSISPYVGLKYNRFRYRELNHLKKIDLNTYLENPGYDLRVSEFSVPIGVSFNFLYKNWFSYGFQVSYNNPFTHFSFVNSANNRIIGINEKILDSLNFSMGFGFGFNYLYKIIKLGNTSNNKTGTLKIKQEW